MAGQNRHRPRALLSPRAALWGPRLAQLVITRRCNIDCGYCNEYDKTSPPVPKEIVKSWVDKLASFSTHFLEYTGGETLLHPDVLELVEYGSSYGFRERWIITNGYLLSPAIVDGLNDGGLTHLQISIDGVTPNAVTVKVLKPLRKKLELLAARAKFKVQVNAVLGATNADEVIEVARAVRELGFSPRVSVIHDEHGALALTERGLDAMREIGELVGKRWHESGDYRTRMLRDGKADYKCRAGARYLYVDEFGLVNWCSQQRGVFTKPLLEYTWADLKQQFHTPKTCAPTCTLGCVRTASKYDEWRGQKGTAPPPRAPALNQEALIAASSLVRPLARPKRSQSAWRLEQARKTADGG